MIRAFLRVASWMRKIFFLKATLTFTPCENSVRLVRSGFETIPTDLTRAELFRSFTYSAKTATKFLTVGEATIN